MSAQMMNLPNNNNLIAATKEALCDSTTLKSQAFLKQIALSQKLPAENVLYPIFNMLALNELEIAAWSIILEKFGMDHRLTQQENLYITAFAAKISSCYNVDYFQDILEKTIVDFVPKYQRWSARKEHELSLTLKEVNSRFKQMNDQCNSVNPLVDPWNGDFNRMVEFLDSDESTCPNSQFVYPKANNIHNNAIVGVQGNLAGQDLGFLDAGVCKKVLKGGASHTMASAASVHDRVMEDDFLWEDEALNNQDSVYFGSNMQNSDALAPISDDFLDEIDRF